MTQNSPNWPDFSNCCPICKNHVDANSRIYNISDVNHDKYHKTLKSLTEKLMSKNDWDDCLDSIAMGCIVQEKICKQCKLNENICLCKKLQDPKYKIALAHNMWPSKGCNCDICMHYFKSKNLKPICKKDIQDLKEILDNNENKQNKSIILDSVGNIKSNEFYFGHQFPELMKLPGGQSWFELILSNKKELNKWLEIQYHDFIKSAERIEYYSFPIFLELDPLYPEEYKYSTQEELPKLKKYHSWIKTIIAQKKLHAKWIGEILNKNGIDSTVLQDDQYWNWKNIPDRNLLGFEQFCALCENYEHINQNKIKILAENEFSPKELKNIFKKILNQKQFHIKAFQEMAGNEYVNVEKLIKEFNLRK